MVDKILTKDKLKDQVFKISAFKAAIKRTKPHKHGGYYELIYLSHGEGFHWIESQHYKVSPPDLYFMKPDQMHCWQFTDIPKGYVLLFKESMLDPLREAPLLALIHQLKVVTRISMDKQMNLSATFEGMLKEYEKPSTFSQEIILGYLRSLFALVLKHSGPGDLQNGEAPSTLYRRFTALLNEKCPKEVIQVRDFAELLGTSTQNLSAACKKYGGGLSASQHVTHQLIVEAKRNVLHTDLSVSEIAEMLRFNDASYFVKFFKKHTGQTPHQFRQSYLS